MPELRHARIGDYLAAHPELGLVATEGDGGLPRTDWPEGMPLPDLEAWVIVHDAQARAAQQAAAVEAAQAGDRRQALRDLLATWDGLSNAQRDARIRQAFPALVRHLLKMDGAL